MLLMMKMMMIAVRTSVSQDQVTATLCTKELFLSTQCIYSSPRLTDGQPCGRGGKDTGVNTIHLAGSAGSHTSQPDLTAGCRFSDKTEYFYAFILWLGKTIKLFFLFPVTPLWWQKMSTNLILNFHRAPVISVSCWVHIYYISSMFMYQQFVGVRMGGIGGRTGFFRNSLKLKWRTRWHYLSSYSPISFFKNICSLG